jgi:hypothetical protein
MALDFLSARPLDNGQTQGFLMKNFFALLCGAVILLLQACAGTPLSSTTSEADLKTKAVVILSVSHDQGAADGAEAIFIWT